MANAGSGKTYVLARRVVRLLLEGARPESILCLTYTKAAASEMRERIVALLKSLAIAQGEALTKTLNDIMGESPSPQHTARAASLLSAVLDSPLGGMTITTIHGFCQRLLAGFPLEAGISPHASLLDDREQTELIQQAIYKLYITNDSVIAKSLSFIADIAAEGRLNQWLTQLIYQRNEWKSLTDLTSDDAMKRAIEARQPLDSYERDVWRKRLQEGVVTSLISAAIGIWEAGGAHTKTAATSAREWLANPQDSTYLSLWLTQEHQPRKTILPEKLFAGHEVLREQLEREQQRVYAITQALATIATAEETYHMAVLARAVNQIYTNTKLVRSALDYEDLIVHVETLFAHELPWVMTKLDYRIDHLLLDEAQDTSPAQWRISEALVKELLASDAPSGQTRSIFVVGDVKQSIYSFQGAAPEMFEAMRDDWSKALPISSFTLSKSYRSAAPILEVASAICGTEHALHRQGMAGIVECWPLIDPPEKEIATPYELPTEYRDESRAESMLALQIAGTIRAWLDEGRVLKARGRAVQAGDIMILVHRRKPMTPLLIRELQRMDVPVAGIDRLALSTHLAVRDVIALIRWLYAPEDDVALAQILRSPLVGMSEEALFDVAHNRGEASLWQQVKSNESLQRWRGLRGVTPYQFIYQLLEIEGLRRAYASRFGNEIHEVLDELLEHAALSERDVTNLFAYADQLEHAGREIKRESVGGQAHNEVRVMTVHGAKGLEAPIVILADTTSAPDLRKEMWFDGPTIAITDEAKNAGFLDALKAKRRDAMQQEYERLLYVAITRAEDECYITGAKPPRVKDINPRCWYALSRDALKSLPNVESHEGTYRAISAQTAPVEEVAVMPVAREALPVWAHNAAPQENKTQHFSPSRLGNSELALYDKSEGDARTRGVIIHRLLELAPQHATPETLAQLAQFIAPDWQASQRQAIVSDVHRLLQHPDMGWVWQEQGFNEVGVSGQIEMDGVSYPMSGQIDRLVMRKDEIIILDYKTSANLPQTVAQTSQNYLLQMKAYKTLFANKYSDKTIRCALVWTHAPRLDWLDEIVAKMDWDSFRLAS
ncbi:MAG: UvrD-helicase domain-containing protein [Alphaproteobacteria bacterium]|nr:UvrD-helicase domain-containing protein [Alphaproteobacteria bacterium]